MIHIALFHGMKVVRILSPHLVLKLCIYSMVAQYQVMPFQAGQLVRMQPEKKYPDISKTILNHKHTPSRSHQLDRPRAHRRRNHSSGVDVCPSTLSPALLIIPDALWPTPYGNGYIGYSVSLSER